MNIFKYIIFDLDDTLLDTYNLLITKAVEKSCRSMIQSGLPAKEELCIQLWNQLHHNHSEQELYLKIIENSLSSENLDLNTNKTLLSEDQKNNWAQIGFDSFLKPNLPEQLPLKAEIRQMMIRLQKKYSLFLVTQGVPEIQREKINKMNISSFFQEIFIVNTQAHETKKHKFEHLLKTVDNNPLHFLSVGNRLRHEIAMAKQLGMQTCHVQQGEHKNEKPQNSFESSDWTINCLEELEMVCHL